MLFNKVISVAWFLKGAIFFGLYGTFVSSSNVKLSMSGEDFKVYLAYITLSLGIGCIIALWSFYKAIKLFKYLVGFYTLIWSVLVVVFTIDLISGLQDGSFVTLKYFVVFVTPWLICLMSIYYLKVNSVKKLNEK